MPVKKMWDHAIELKKGENLFIVKKWKRRGVWVC